MFIFIVDDHELVRQGLRQLVNGEIDMHICGKAGLPHRPRGHSQYIKTCSSP